MTQPGPDLVPSRRRFIVSRPHAEGVTLKRRLARQGFQLNRTGKAIWSLCDGRTSVKAICNLLERSFESSAGSIRQDILSTLAELERHGLLLFENKPRRNRGATTIDLRNIPFYVINCKADTVKREHMRQQLSQLGLRFEMVDAIECSPSSLGTTLSHLKILAQKDIKPPFGILEDDCVFNEHFRYTFDLPADTGAFYLGVSRFGIEFPGKLSWGKWDQVIWSRYDRNNLRVYNMLALHAVLYLSNTFRQAALDATTGALTNFEYEFPGDVGVASTHLNHLVLTPIEPICYQSALFGGQEDSTRSALTEI